MADNITLNSGSGGETVKTDDDGTAHWQYTKTAFGADGTQTRVTSSVGLPSDLIQVGGTATATNAGNADGGTQRVVLATDQAAVAVKDIASGTPAQAQVTVNNTSTTIKTANTSRKEITITNRGSNGVYLCFTGTATTSHYLLNQNESFTFTGTAAVTGITASGSDTVHYVEVAYA